MNATSIEEAILLAEVPEDSSHRVDWWIKCYPLRSVLTRSCDDLTRSCDDRTRDGFDPILSEVNLHRAALNTIRVTGIKEPTEALVVATTMHFAYMADQASLTIRIGSAQPIVMSNVHPPITPIIINDNDTRPDEIVTVTRCDADPAILPDSEPRLAMFTELSQRMSDMCTLVGCLRNAVHHVEMALTSVKGDLAKMAIESAKSDQLEELSRTLDRLKSVYR